MTKVPVLLLLAHRRKLLLSREKCEKKMTAEKKLKNRIKHSFTMWLKAKKLEKEAVKVFKRAHRAYALAQKKKPPKNSIGNIVVGTLKPMRKKQ
jgi:hypothetical protein